MKHGIVHLVGAGPGDPGLMTIKGMELLRSAQVVIFDSLVGEALLQEASASAEKIDVGKRGGCHKAEQHDINQLLFDKASQGRTVVRLKGGDPFLFGRGGEEAEFLRQKGVEVHVVPGVSSSLAVPALCGIPVTHRHMSSSVTIVTGHEGDHKDSEWLDWATLARGGGTLVIMMGMSNLKRNMDRLMDGGVRPDTAVAVLQEGSTPRQKVLLTTVADAHRECAEAGMKAPAVIVVGAVATMRRLLGDLL